MRLFAAYACLRNPSIVLTRSHALRGNAVLDAPASALIDLRRRRRASQTAFPRRTVGTSVRRGRSPPHGHPTPFARSSYPRSTFPFHPPHPAGENPFTDRQNRVHGGAIAHNARAASAEAPSRRSAAVGGSNTVINGFSPAEHRPLCPAKVFGIMTLIGGLIVPSTETGPPFEDDGGGNLSSSLSGETKRANLVASAVRHEVKKHQDQCGGPFSVLVRPDRSGGPDIRTSTRSTNRSRGSA